MTIPIDHLRSVTRIVCHSDADGIASAMILRDVLPDASIEFVQYSTRAHVEMAVEPEMLFCDFSPPRERVAEFVEAGAIVFDHHEHARDVVAAFGELGVFGESEKLESGAWLAYRHWLALHPTHEHSAAVKQFALMTAIRDTWQTDHMFWDEACEQAEAINFYGGEYLTNEHEPYLSPNEQRLGKLLYQRKLDQARKVALSAIELGDLRIFPDPRGITSDVAEALRAGNFGGRVAAGFFYTSESNGLRIVFSLRALDDETDVGAIAKANGGGGHKAAAGFSLTVMEDGETINAVGPTELLLRSLVGMGLDW